MCQTKTLVPVPDFLMADAREYSTETVFDEGGVPCFNIDTCIVPAVQALWVAGIKTVGCCCGHGMKFGVISVETKEKAIELAK